MIWEAQTGSAFIDCEKSFLEFTVLSDAAGSFGVGSALNCIQDSLVISRSGTELSRCFNVNLWGKYRQDWENSNAWATQVGPAQGYPAGATAALTTAVKTYCIPLKYISPFFDQKSYLPPQVMEGLRIRLDLATSGTAIVDTVGAGVSSFTISAPKIHWSTAHLADAFRRKVLEISASRGLVLLHKEVYHQQISVNGTAFNYEIRKAASKALSLAVIPRINSEVGNNTVSTDSMSSEIFNFTKAQIHIGSDYFPQQALEGTATNANQMYNYCLQAHNKLGGKNPPNVTYGFASGVAGQYNGELKSSKASVAFDLNKSGVSDLDGYVVNNSRSVVVDITMVSADRRLDSFMQHLRAVKVYPSNCDVKD